MTPPSDPPAPAQPSTTATPRTTPPSSRTTVRRLPERARYDAAAVHEILDAAWVCHLGFVTPDGPVVIPTTYGRDGDVLYVHGAPATGFARHLGGGAPVSVAVTHVDGLVLARSAFHHSVNYRSVVVFGTAHLIDDADEKRRALDCLVDHVLRGRSAEVRPPTDKELRGTAVLAIPIEEASAKVRTGPPVDDDEDLASPVWGSTWAGVVPLTPTPGVPEADGFVPAGTALPASVERLLG